MISPAEILHILAKGVSVEFYKRLEHSFDSIKEGAQGVSNSVSGCFISLWEGYQ